MIYIILIFAALFIMVTFCHSLTMAAKEAEEITEHFRETQQDINKSALKSENLSCQGPSQEEPENYMKEALLHL